MTQLPAGFVLDQPQGGLPEGFVLDQAQQAPLPQASNVGAKGNREVGLAETVGDVVQAAGTGLRAGTEALIGLPGTVQDLVETGFEAGRSLFVDETPEQKAKRLAIAESVSAPGIPRTEDIQGVTNRIFGEPRAPQTTAGEFTRTIAEFAPAMAAGPGSALTKGVTTLAAGGASEAAGQLTEGTEAEPFARAAGALTGGLAGISAVNRAAKQALKSAPAEADVKKITDQLYAHLRQSGIKYNPAAFDKATQDLAVKLHSRGFRAGTAPKAFAIVDELIGSVGKQLDFDDLDSIRRAAGKVLTNPDNTERAVARIVVEAIDDFGTRAPIVNTAGRTSAEVKQLTLRARDFASRNIKQRKVNEAIAIGMTRQSGAEAGIRNEIGKLLNSKKVRFTPEERTALMAVAKGNFGRNAVRTLSRFGVDFSQLGNTATLIPGGAIGAGTLAGEPITATALVGAGTIAKTVARKQTQKAAEEAKKVIRLGRKGQGRLSAEQRSQLTQSSLRRLLLLDPVSQQAATPAVQ